MSVDKTFRTGRQAYEMAVSLAAQVTPGDLGFVNEMSEKARQHTLEAAHLWASIAQAHATLAMRDSITRQCATISRALGAMGAISEGEAKLRVGNDDGVFDVWDDES